MKQINSTPKWMLPLGVALCTGGLAYLLWIKGKQQRNKLDQRPSSLAQLPSNQSPAPRQITGSTPTAPPSAQIVKEPNWRSPFDMRYEIDVAQWLTPKRAKTISKEKALRLAEQIKSSKGIWNDDEKAVQQAFKSLADKVEVAGLSRVFYERYKLDLWEFLRSFLSQREMERYVHKHVRGLSDYRVL